MLPLPQSVRALHDAARGATAGMPNAGLLLDKYVEAESQQVQKDVLKGWADAFNASRGVRAGTLDAALARRRASLAGGNDAARLELTLRAPLAIHLARASGLENAGLAMHRVLGFPVIPGTGLKGMSRAYALTVEQADPGRILEVFGNEPGAADAHAGTVVFHDAWPARWPTLTVDVASNHHRDYYDGNGAPGDWEGPNPIYFPVVEAGATFDFILGKRRPDVAARDLDDARRWLTGALVSLGAGAKTGAGYGWFEPPAGFQPRARGISKSYEVELVSPAFLAGARQEEADATLRSATVKSLLRWWWRTLHSGALSTKALLELEKRLFGGTGGQSPVEIVVVPAGPRTAAPAPYKRKAGERLEWNPTFAEQRKLHWDRQNNLPVGYAGFGMADHPNHRVAVEPGARWRVEVHARTEPTAGKGGLSERAALDQVELALMLLCRFGGAGAKARKGFGSLRVTSGLEVPSLDAIRNRAAEFRKAHGLDVRAPSTAAKDGAASVEYLAGKALEVETQWTDPWYAMNELGAALRAVASAHKHDERKVALGLPRRIHGPTRAPLKHQSAANHQPPRDLNGKGKAAKRHASPVHFSLGRRADGKLSVNVIAFVSALLPSEPESRAFLTAYLSELEAQLRERMKLTTAKPGAAPLGGPPSWRPSPGGHARGGGPSRGAAPAPKAAPPSGENKGDIHTVTLVRNEKKDRLDAEFSTPKGPRKGFFPSAKPPADAQAGLVGKARVAKRAPASPSEPWELEWVGE